MVQFLPNLAQRTNVLRMTRMCPLCSLRRERSPWKQDVGSCRVTVTMAIQVRPPASSCLCRHHREHRAMPRTYGSPAGPVHGGPPSHSPVWPRTLSHAPSDPGPALLSPFTQSVHKYLLRTYIKCVNMFKAARTGLGTDSALCILDK